ncbi:hypothetical protein CcaverHIS002_0306900 [Cutaneotrichosporon cavernicola]|uniref:Pali-domain-containing protein n=1 Tax=Cutaneotrichosporon cavernicola TaxID=279322 RepID=A0AA48I7B0_9TREE|nr:uncharacterized protein CcaverHIS019_0306820 [Cutaneotrichosporon cavernicola]BEI82822.1 hypothetical protein CcaverHIS002_0306900 [Cutaneotrichosporon cavernicola]BEI90612.1 hypothetical protein CcaverHIS019_0306820 [Cutaneotrichosporon cavernicola]BEI98390.1 hypothetical protein CcaverHIS631_0306890 [Cutaneotrichosporon cavernicola]BEJ06163.1 hypothetical protein CcaverHIS641_0306850 [Cutaneotrichosporon cavernicola]
MVRWNRDTSITGRIQTGLLLLCFLLTVLPSFGPPIQNVFALQTFSSTKMGNGQISQRTIWAGPFGYCSSDKGCVRASLGYDLATELSASLAAKSDWDEKLIVATKYFIAIPISAGIALIAFIISSKGEHIGSAITSAVLGVFVSISSGIATIMTWSAFKVSSYYFGGVNGAQSRIGPGGIMLLIATIVSGFCWVLGIVECYLARKDKKRRKSRHRTDLEYAPVCTAKEKGQDSSADVSLISNPAPLGIDPHYQDPYNNSPIPGASH